MTEKTTTLRLRRVRFKDGRVLEVFRPRRKATDTHIAEAIERDFGQLREFGEGNSVHAYSLVAWRTDGTVFVTYEVAASSPIQAGQIPQMVKDVLLAEAAIRWSRPE